MRLYWIRAQAPRRVLGLIKHLGLNVDCVEVDARAGGLGKPDYVALNPNKKAPTLVDGDYVLWEASAIMAYLCIKAGSDMWPADKPLEQVEVLRWLSWNDCHWNGAVGPFYFEHIVKKTFGLGPANSEALQTKRGELAKYAGVLNAHLAGKSYVACGRLTIADFQLAGMAHYWREAEMPFQDFPHIAAWLDRLDALPAWADPWPAKAA